MNSSETTVGIVAETTWGETPSPAVFVPLRFNGETLKVGRESVKSEEIRPDRNVAGSKIVSGDANGGCTGELSYGNLDSLIESALFSTWVTNVIENAVTQKSFAIQKKQSGGGDSPVYELYNGMVVDTLTFEINAAAKITYAVTFAGKDGVPSDTITGSFGTATTGDIFDASNSFELTEAFGVSPLPKIMKMTIAINNGLSGKPVAGQVALDHISAGQCDVSGSLEFYFQNKDLMDLFIAGTGGEIALTLGETTGEKYSISMPEVKLTDGSHFSPNNDDDVMFTAPFQASYDTSLGATIQFTRAVA